MYKEKQGCLTWRDLLKCLGSVHETGFLTEKIFGATEFDKQERMFRYEVAFIRGLSALFGGMQQK